MRRGCKGRKYKLLRYSGWRDRIRFGLILTGLKIRWPFAWRTLIIAELVFCVSSGQRGPGWFILENRNLLDMPAVFAALLTVIVIGLIVENLIFRTIERNTVQKWGTPS